MPLEHGGSFTADGSTITFGLSDAAAIDDPFGSLDAGIGLLTQQLQIQYQQPVNRVYELGTNKAYYIAGRAQGQAGLNRILGPSPIMLAFYESYGNVCNAGQNILEFRATTNCNGETNPGEMLMSMYGVVLTSISDTVRAEDMVVNEQLQLMFLSLLVDTIDELSNP